ncbi:SDR family NAD(P)-dependent oxidoreductase [Candidatus Latescibacterota bacterium]
MGKLDSKTAVVTGGGTGIGLAIAKRFHDEGAFVVICGRRKEKLAEAESIISSDGERVFSVTADVMVEEDIIRVVDKTVAKTGRLDVLVNNAGIMRFGKLHETPVEEFHAMMKTNVFGSWRMMVHAVPHMRKVGGGSIINLSSIAGIKAFPGAGAYCTSKAALQMISQVMSMEVCDDNIRVNLILPALVEDTELAEPIFGKENIPAFYDKLRLLHPLGRNGRPKDIADAALYFATDDSSWVTGVMLNVDGGRHLTTNRPTGV